MSENIKSKMLYAHHNPDETISIGYRDGREVQYIKKTTDVNKKSTTLCIAGKIVKITSNSDIEITIQ